SSMGFTLDTPFGLERLEEADLVAVPAITDDLRLERGRHPEPLLAALRRTIARGGRVLSVCTGAFLLGAAGVPDGGGGTAARRGCWTGGGAGRTGGACPSWRAVTRPPTSTPRCSTWTPTRSSPAPAPPPASTPVSTWSARSTAAGWPTPSRGGWWCRRTATAGR